MVVVVVVVVIVVAVAACSVIGPIGIMCSAAQASSSGEQLATSSHYIPRLRLRPREYY